MSMRAALPLKATNAHAERAEERARAKTPRAQIDELNAALAGANTEADRTLTEERQRPDLRLEALSAEILRAEKQAGAAIGRAERAEAARDAERSPAEALQAPSTTSWPGGPRGRDAPPASSLWRSTTPTWRSRRLRSYAGQRPKRRGKGPAGTAQGGVAGRLARRSPASDGLPRGANSCEKSAFTQSWNFRIIFYDPSL